ncbi:MAG: acetamidase/formamidase family protein [Alphaproteobacteria bacterium]|nr:acetamidase/formamidase family protein [Alphaproteobacteria bacterium]
MTHHHLKAGPETCHWGVFDAALPPVLTVASGDTVTVETISGSPEVMPAAPFEVLPELRQVHARVPRGPGHILTGPIRVEGAAPGDVLEIAIEAVEPRQDWGWMAIQPLRGTLPADFPERRLAHFRIDREARMVRLPWGMNLPLRPFFGVMGVAPPQRWGRIDTIVPRDHGGNIDLKEMTAGATLYLPVWVEGANFSTGDGHGVQGDGEVCLTALETALTGTFRLTVRKDLRFRFPRAETPTHLITLGLDEDLDDAARQALREMIGLIVERTNLSKEEAYMLCSLAVDLRVTQTVDGNKGIHAMLAKSLLAG